MIYKEDLKTIRELCGDVDTFNLSFHIDYLLMDKIWKQYSNSCCAGFLNYISEKDKLILLKAINHYIKNNEEDMETQQYSFKIRDLKYIDKLNEIYIENLQNLYDSNMLFDDFTLTLEFLFEVIFEYYLFNEIKIDLNDYLNNLTKKDIILAVGLYKLKYPQVFVVDFE